MSNALQERGLRAGTRRHRVVVVGGGFGGVRVAQALAKAPVDVTLVDRMNHHLFQPLLYQVATAALSGGEIARRCGVSSASKRTRGSCSPT
ncbi:MAG: FAD-dependent oxidoreductase [Rhizomicrobium sp.]